MDRCRLVRFQRPEMGGKMLQLDSLAFNLVQFFLYRLLDLLLFLYVEFQIKKWRYIVRRPSTSSR